MSKQVINNETSQIKCQGLQRFFASGLVIVLDNKLQVEQWLKQGWVAPISNQQALLSNQQTLQWYEKDQAVWVIVIKSWALVQDKMHEQGRY